MNRSSRMPGRSPRTITISPFACLFSAVCAALALVAGCSGPQQLPLTAMERGGVISGFTVDSLTGQLVGGAEIRLDSLSITETADERGRFAVNRLPLGARIVTVSHPGYFDKTALFDLSVSDDSLFQRIQLMPKAVEVTCPANFDRYHTRLQEDFSAQENAVRLAILGMTVRGATVTVRPLLVNQLNEVLFIPDQYGYYGQYEVELYDGSGRLLPFTYENAPETPTSDDRIYTSRDILTIPPGTSERLSPIRLQLKQKPTFGDQITARLRYNFALDEPVRGSLSSAFPPIEADTLIAAGRQIEVKTVARLVALADLVRAQSQDADSLAADSTTSDTLLAADSLMIDSLAADSAEAVAVLDSSQTAAVDTMAADSLADETRATIIASTDSSALRMLADTTQARADALATGDSLATADSLVLADSTIVADTLTANGPMVVQEAVVIRTGYNTEDIAAWKKAQATRLVEPYCQMLRRELVSETWTTTVQ